MSKCMLSRSGVAYVALLAIFVVSIVGQDGRRGGARSASRNAAPENAYINNQISTGDPMYQRTNGTCAGLASSPNGGAVHYKTIQFTAPNAGSVTISVNDADGGSAFASGGGGTNGPDTYLALYGTAGFVPATPLVNCLAVNDNVNGTISRSSITTTVPAAGTYTVVISTAKDTPANSAVFPEDGALPWSFVLSVRGAASPILFGANDFLISAPSRGVVASFDSSLNFKGNLDAFLGNGNGITAINQKYAVAMDRGNHRVNVYNTQGSVVQTFTNANIDGNTVEIKAGTSGRYYMGGGGPSPIKEVDQTGTQLRSFGAVGINYIAGVVVLPNNIMWGYQNNASSVDIFNLAAGSGSNIAPTGTFALNGGQTKASSMTYCAVRNSVIMSDSGGNVYERNAANGALLQTYNMALVVPVPLGGTAYKAKNGATCGPNGDVYVMTNQDAGGEARVARFNSAGAFQNTVDVSARTGDATNIIWLGNVSTAAGVTVSGRVTTASGRGITNAQVMLMRSDGSVTTVVTGRSGNFGFVDVEAGRSYTIFVNSTRFSFTPQVVNVNDNVTGMTFVTNQ